MNTNFWKFCLLGAFLLTIAGCVDSYQPPEITAPNRYLVVDGFLNGSGPTVIRLSRTRNLADARKASFETKALVQVEGEKTKAMTLAETSTGVYTLSSTLGPGDRYRLRVKTSGGTEYLSDYVAIKQTPPIERLTWQPLSNAVQIYVDTRDPSNNTRYYRWEYQDTYEFNSAYEPLLEVAPGNTIRDRSSATPENIYKCWTSGASTEIMIGSTERLSQDVLSKQPLLLVATNTPKLRVKYSILVRQYAQTREAYEYWDNLKKNTEQLGSLFDPLPSQLPGNIRCVTNPSEPVLGYLSGHTVAEMRLFISNAELPAIVIPNGNESCMLDTVEAKYQSAMIASGMLPVSTLDGTPYSKGVDVLMSHKACVDCREKGTNIRPSFWK